MGINQQGLLFSWYQVQQEDAYQLQIISLYGEYCVRTRIEFDAKANGPAQR
jgi:hypothetical protein